MRRHGWALFLGMLAAAPAMAQPPADGERYPPPPDMPGTVVGRTPDLRPTAVALPAATQRISLKPGDPAVMPPLPTTQPAPYTPNGTATVLPVEPAGPVGPPPGEAMPAPGCAAPAAGCAAGHGSFRDWCTFRSRARQSGCYPPPYAPPLQAWFPCDPKQNCYGPRACPPVGSAVPGVMPVGPLAGPVPPPPGLEPPAPPAGPVPTGCPDREALTSFEKVADGLGFTPGGAPMACPTRQITTSKWRPR